MVNFNLIRSLSVTLRAAILAIGLIPEIGFPQGASPLTAFPPVASAFPAPLLNKRKAVDWWFVFKFNAKSFPGCGLVGNEDGRTCSFGGTVQDYAFGQQFVYASGDTPALQKGVGCTGTTVEDPVGATFDEIYNGNLFFVVWNDQFYDNPSITGCGESCSSPWGHSKGVLAWNEAGEGLILQVTTPSWPASGSASFPRRSDGNTLGCIKDDNVKVSQHFFALRLSKDDVLAVLQALQNASVVTDPGNPQIVKNGGPAAFQALVQGLGVKSNSTTVTRVRLSSGVGLISKPSALHVPPWQLVSSLLGGVALRTATWWASPKISTTTPGDTVGCWATDLDLPGPVQIATSGEWMGSSFGLRGGPGADFNHAKVGVSTSGNFHFSIFGDMNQQGSLSGPNCASSQNGRGGIFYVIENQVLAESIASLIKGDSAAPGEE
jgi:hypothetical protein